MMDIDQEITQLVPLVEDGWPIFSEDKGSGLHGDHDEPIMTQMPLGTLRGQASPGQATNGLPCNCGKRARPGPNATCGFRGAEEPRGPPGGRGLQKGCAGRTSHALWRCAPRWPSAECSPRHALMSCMQLACPQARLELLARRCGGDAAAARRMSSCAGRTKLVTTRDGGRWSRRSRCTLVV